jgi:hypothetical protein
MVVAKKKKSGVNVFFIARIFGFPDPDEILHLLIAGLDAYKTFNGGRTNLEKTINN